MLEEIIIDLKQNENAICLCISGAEDENPFSLKNKDKIYKDVWVEKLQAGGEFILQCDEIEKIESILRNNVDEKTRKAYRIYRDDVREKLLDIKIMLEKVFSHENLLNEIANFEIFLEGVIDTKFYYLRKQALIMYKDYIHKESEEVTLEIYNNKDSFKFDFDREEYERVKDFSGGRIDANLMSCKEFMGIIKDKTIWDRTILPEYLLKVTIKEESTGQKIKYDPIGYWTITRG